MIQPVEIYNEIKNRPPAQRNDASKHYRGLKVSWRLKFRGIVSTYKINSIKIFAWPKTESGFDMYPTIWIEVEKNKYPEINILKENQVFKVTGEIASAETYDITLTKCVLDFEEETLIKSQNIKNETKNIEKNFWEKPWFQIIILLSALATIIGVLSSF